MSYVVYIHENIINGKVYIGITGQKPSKRWDNGRGYNNNVYFHSAIVKYGWHNFTHRILYDNLTLEQANEIEKCLIQEYGSTDPSKGYNIDLGGNGTGTKTAETREKLSKSHKGQQAWNKGREHPPETRKKICEALTGGKLSAETRAKMSQSRSGKGNSFYGKHHSKDVIHKMALNQPNRKMVICLDTGTVYESMAEASRQTGIKQGNISLACNGKQNRAGGLRWAIYGGE